MSHRTFRGQAISMSVFSLKRLSQVAASTLLVALTGCSTEYFVTPIADSSQSVRYEQGHAIVYSDNKFGAVQITPLGMNSEDRLGFSVSALNKSAAPANFGIENITFVQADGTPGKLFTAGELEHEAKVKAGWQTFAAVLGAVGGGMAANANAHSTTSGVVYTPGGAVSYTSRSYNPAVAQEGMREASAEFGDNMHAIKASLNETMNVIQNHVLQTTTIDPGDSYGGIALADTLSSSKFPQTFALGVTWNGEDHVFRFIVSTDKSPAPQQTAPVSVADTPLPVAAPSAQPLVPVIAPVPQPAMPAVAAPAQPAEPVVSVSLQRKETLPEGYASHSDSINSSQADAPAVSFDQWEKAQRAKSNSSVRRGIVISGGVSPN